MVDDPARMPLRPGEETQMRRVRFRALGYWPLTGAVESPASTLPEIIQEMLLATTSERQGCAIDVVSRFFSTDRRKFIVAGTRGHEQYTRNMATGA